MSDTLPQYNAERSINTAPSSAEASPLAFDSTGSQGMANLGRGAEQFSEGFSRLAADMVAVNKRKRNENDMRWVHNAIASESKVLTDYMVDPQNNQREDYAQSFHKFATDRLQNEEMAPSKDAAKAYHAAMLSHITRLYSQAASTTEMTRLDNTKSDIMTQISDSLGSYRNELGMPNGRPVESLYSSHQRIGNLIENIYGELAPANAKKLQATLDSEYVLGAMQDHPAFSKYLLETSQNLDERERTILQRHLDQSLNSMSLVRQDQFNRMRQDYLQAVSQGKGGGKIPLETYQTFLPKDHAEIQKAHDDEAIDTFTLANGITTEIGPKDANSQLVALNKLRDEATDVRHKNVYEIVSQQVQENIKLQRDNRVAWMDKFNPEVMELDKRIADTPTADMRQAAVSDRTAAIKRYQGFAPKDDPHPDYYLGLPSNDRKVLTNEEAADSANRINRGQPTEAIKMINDVISKYGDDSTMALNDLVSLPGDKGIRQDYQLAFLNQNAWWLDTYIGAISHSKSLSKLDDTKRADMERAIDSNNVWQQFRKSMIGDNFARADEIQGFKYGIQSLTHALADSGMPMKQAVETSMSRLISEQLGFTRVNGQSLAIARERKTPGVEGPQLPSRTDEDMFEIGRRLGVSLGEVDPRAINQDNFPFLKSMGTDVAKMQALRDQVTSRGFFVVGNDGQTASLYVRDDNGMSFQVTDKDHRPFQIHVDDLPDYREPVYEGEYGTQMFRNFPKKTHDILERAPYIGRDPNVLGPVLGLDRFRTNWPSMSTFRKPVIDRVKDIPPEGANK